MSSEQGVNIINGSGQNSPVESRSSSPTHTQQQQSIPAQQKTKRFQNGWSKEQERLMAEWSDIAICYRWLHDRSDKIFHVKTLLISLPVIFLSTISGFSNIGVQAILDSDEMKKYASFAIAGVSLFAGLLTTIGDRLRYAQLEESHRVAAIAWGKFQRLIAVELALNPNDRMDSLDFLKICRADLDRLIEQSPSIPKESIALFEKKFGQIKDLKKPDICGALEHTNVFSSSEERLKQVAVEASLMLRRKKQTLSELVSPEIERIVEEQVQRRVTEAIEDRKKRLEYEIEIKRLEEQKEREDREKALEERRKKIQEEIELEKQKLYSKISSISQAVSIPERSSSGSQFETRLNYKRASLKEPPKHIAKTPSASSLVDIESQVKQNAQKMDLNGDKIIIVSRD
jgi:hypothetical protein